MDSGCDLLPLKSGAVFDIGPFETADRAFELLVAARMLPNEIHIQHAFTLMSTFCFIVGSYQRLAQADNRGEIAAGTELVILRADRRFRQGKHLRRGLWVGEPFKSPFSEWIECNDRCPSLAHRLQLMKHSGAVHTDILPEEEHAIGIGKVLEFDRADRHADSLGKRD